MGLFDDEEELDALFEEASIYPSFIGELNEGTVQAIFNRCLATDDTSPDNIVTDALCTTFMENGRIKYDMLQDFKRDEVKKSERTIRYLYGQLELVHNDDIVLTLKKAVQRYDKVVWTTDQEVIVKFLHIGSVCGTLIGYDTEDFIASINAKDLRPTLSPTDSNFPAWWEEHKAEWED